MNSTITRVPRFDYLQQYQTIRREILAAVDQVFQSGHLILGPRVEAFEEGMCSFLGVAWPCGRRRQRNRCLGHCLACPRFGAWRRNHYRVQHGRRHGERDPHGRRHACLLRRRSANPLDGSRRRGTADHQQDQSHPPGTSVRKRRRHGSDPATCRTTPATRDRGLRAIVAARSFTAGPRARGATWGAFRSIRRRTWGPTVTAGCVSLATRNWPTRSAGFAPMGATQNR